MQRWTPHWNGYRMRCIADKRDVGMRALIISFRLVTLAAVAGLGGSALAQERAVNFYNWSNYVAPGVLEDFTKETGIRVIYDTFDANETLETRLLAGKSGYDVVVPTGYFLQR